MNIEDSNKTIFVEYDSKVSVSYNHKVLVVVDGLFYNGKDLRRKHSIALHSSDAEMISTLVENGNLALEDIEGKFALLIVKRQTQEVLCAVDRFGEKKLCYTVNDNRAIVSTNAKDIARIRNDYSMDDFAIGMYFAHNYICAPYTIFRKVYKIEPGSMVKFEGTKYETYKYWNVISLIQQYKNTNLTISFEDAKEDFKRILNRTIAKREQSFDCCRMALLLSGGIDSSVLCSLLRNHNGIKAYSARLKDEKNNKLDESDSANTIAKKFGVPIDVISIDPDAIKQDLLKIQVSTDEPMANKSYSVVAWLIERAKKDGYNCVITGDGGDELFLGYPHYQRMIKSQKLSNCFSVLPPVFNSLLRTVAPRKLYDVLVYSKTSPMGQYLTAIRGEMLSALLKKTIQHSGSLLLSKSEIV